MLRFLCIKDSKAKLTGLQIGSFQHVRVHTHVLLSLRRHLSFSQSHASAFITRTVKSDAVNQFTAMKPSPGPKCFLILVGGSKHSPALPLSLTKVRKIFQRACQHPGQRQTPGQCPRASSYTPLSPNTPAGKARASSAKKL